MSLCDIVAVSAGYFARLIWAWTVLYHTSTLISPCLKLVKRSMVWGLQSSSNLFQSTSKHKSSGDKHQDTYWWSIPKSPDQATTFLHFLASDNIASSQSSIFLHLNFHFRNCYTSYHSQSSPFLSLFMWHIHLLHGLCLTCWRLELWAL